MRKQMTGLYKNLIIEIIMKNVNQVMVFYLLRIRKSTVKSGK
jgi:hypothetical protein